MNLICKICGKDMNPAHVQQGNCHFNCFNSEITVYYIFMFDNDRDVTSNFYVEKDIDVIIETLESLDTEENNGIAIRKTTMPYSKYINLPDFQGF